MPRVGEQVEVFSKSAQRAAANAGCAARFQWGDVDRKMMEVDKQIKMIKR